MLRIAIVTGNYDHIVDGVSVTLQRWVEYVMNAGSQVAILSPSKRSKKESAGIRIALPSLPVPFRSEYQWVTYVPKRAKYALEEFNPDVVHIATPDRAGGWALKWAKSHQIPIIGSFHTNFASYFKYYGLRWIERRIWRHLTTFYNQCDRVYFTSKPAKDYLEKLSLTTSQHIWGRGVDPSRFNPTHRSEDWRTSMTKLERPIIVLWVSRLVREKNLDMFIQAVSAAQLTHPSIVPVIIGEGPMRKKGQALRPKWKWLGEQTGDQLSIAYASSDCFVFPSTSETFGNVTLEALSSGCVPIVADYPINHALIEHGKNGLCCPSDAPSAYANAIVTMARDESLRRNMSRAARESVNAFQPERIHEALYKSIHQLVTELRS